MVEILFSVCYLCIQSSRHLSQIFHLRKLNNWIKSVLIAEASTICERGWNNWATQRTRILDRQYSIQCSNYPLKKYRNSQVTQVDDACITHTLNARSKAPIHALDLGCGKGGDLMKWLKCDKGNHIYN